MSVLEVKKHCLVLVMYKNWFDFEENVSHITESILRVVQHEKTVATIAVIGLQSDYYVHMSDLIFEFADCHWMDWARHSRGSRSRRKTSDSSSLCRLHRLLY